MNQLAFEVKRATLGQGDSKTTYGQTSTFRGIFSPVSRMHGHSLVNLVTVTHYHGYMTLMIFLMVIDSKTRKQTTFFENTHFWWWHTD